ncbi:ABC transporter permease [Shimazuella kribbensis]|uniref:ABC transporter permease n=1 Tax=Shimazuella kribbensis TaxID=139808 RepID=UPI00040AC1AB|nr:ABC transporter permease [Shimazuella kribbensis]
MKNTTLKQNRNSALLTSILSILLGIIVGAILMLLAGYNPLVAYQALLGSAILQPFDLGETIRTTSPLIFIGLAVALAFRTGLFNIGVEGQYIVGSLTAYLVAAKVSLPTGIHALVAVVAGGLAGAAWAALPGLLKAFRGVHEVIISIMMNFIALYFSNVLVRTWLAVGKDSTDKIPPTASLRIGSLSQLFAGARIHMGIILALLAVFVFYYLLWKTKLGYQLRAVGYNRHAAEYAGISVRRNIVLSFLLSGFLAGLAGATELLGTSEYIAIQDAFIGIGFDGIAVALLGANAPVGVVLSALLFGVLTYGGGNMQFVAGVPFEIIRVVFAAIIFFVAAKISFRWGNRKKGKAYA